MPIPRHHLLSILLCVAAAGAPGAVRASAAPPTAPADPDAHYRAGLGLMERSMHDLAIAEFEAYLVPVASGAGPEHAAEARYALAVCLDRVGRREDAARELDRVLTSRSFPLLSDALLLRARLACDSPSPAEALPYLERLSTADASMASTEAVMVMRCEALIAAERADEALVAIASTVAAHPASPATPRLHYLAGRVAADRGDGATALISLAAARAAQPEGPMAVHAALLEASIRLRGGDAAGAAAALRDLATGAPADLADDVSYWLAASERRMGIPAAAAERLDRALMATPNTPLRPDMLLERAAALADAGNAEAAAAYAAFITAAPSDSRVPAARLAQATILAQAGELAEAERLCANVDPRSADRDVAGRALLLRADCAFARGDFAAAAGHYAAAVAQASESIDAPRATARRGACLVRTGRTDEARDLLRQAAQAGGEAGRIAEDELLELAVADGDWEEVARRAPTVLAAATTNDRRDEVLLRQGMALGRLGRPGEAIAALTPLVRDNPRSPHAARAAYELGRCHLAAGDEAAAEASFHACVEGGADPIVEDAALRQWAALAMRNGRPAAARDALERLGTRSPDAMVDLGAVLLATGDATGCNAVLERFLASNASHARAPEALARRAIALARLGRGDEALELFPAEMHGRSSLDAELRTALRLERARLLAERHRDAESDAELRALLDDREATGVHAWAAAELARRSFDAGRLDECVRQADAALAAAVAADAASAARISAHSLYLKGAALARLGQWQQSFESLSALRERHPDSPLRDAAALVEAQALVGLARHAEAIDLLEAAVAGDSHTDSSRLDAALLALGQSYAALERWPESERAYERHRTSCPTSERAVHALFGLAWARERQGRLDDAMDGYRAVLGAHRGPTAARAQFQIGECLYALGRHDDAVREFVKADVNFGVAEWSAASLYEAARCLREAGRPADAQRQLDELVRRFPDSAWAKAAASNAAPRPSSPTTPSTAAGAVP